MSEEEEQIALEDTVAVLAGKPTINERLDVLEALMQQILARLPYSTTGYAQTGAWPSATSSPYTITTTGTTTSAPVTVTWTNNVTK